MHARAAVMKGPGEIAIERFAVPEAEEGSVVLQMSLAGICGTDKHSFRGETTQYAGTQHERRTAFPVICGHENVGIVADVGGEVLATDGTALRVGDRVVPAANVACGRCYYCLNGYPYYMCDHLENYGNSLSCAREPHLLGGWSEYLYLLPNTPIFRVPPELPDEVAVLTEVMAVTHGIDTAQAVLSLHGRPSFGYSALVLGVGPLGLCHVVKARLGGAGKIFATDRFSSRLALAEELGADAVWNVSTTSADERAEALLERTHGRGAEIVVDCSGVPETFEESLRLVAPGGVIVEVGAFVDLGTVGVNPSADICAPNVSIVGVGGETAVSYEPSLDLMAAQMGRYPLEKIVSHRIPLGTVATALQLAQRDEAMQVVLDPRGQSPRQVPGAEGAR